MGADSAFRSPVPTQQALAQDPPAPADKEPDHGPFLHNHAQETRLVLNDLPTRGSAKLYEAVAARIRRLISHGTFKAGDRLPSVRRLSNELQVSVTTVVEAYRLLESQGAIEARPQSGYYVRPSFPHLPHEIEVSHPPSSPSPVGVDELVMRVIQDTRDPSLIPLGAAIPDPQLLPTHKLNRSLISTARRMEGHGHVYDAPPGCEALRIQVAQRMLAAGCTLTPDEIVTTCGCLEAISLSLRAICQPGDTVAIESPTYFGILQALQYLGLKALEVPTHPRTGISIEALENALRHNKVSACVVVTNFNNPLGCLMPDEEKRRLVEVLAVRQIPLIEDDIYGDLSYSDERPHVAKAYDQEGLVLLCSSYSKDLAPGYRVGWVAPGRFKQSVMRLKASTNIATPTLPQLAVADFLANGGYDRHLARLRRVYSRQVALVAQAVLRSFPTGTRVSQPQGGFVLWVEMPPQVDSLHLYEEALRERITLAPGPIFSAKQGYRNFLRLNCAWWSEKVEQALPVLGRLATREATLQGDKA